MLLSLLNNKIEHKSDDAIDYDSLNEVIRLLPDIQKTCLPQIIDYLEIPAIYLDLLLHEPIRWESQRLDVLIESVLQEIKPYLLGGAVQVSLPDRIPQIKSNSYFLTKALAYLLYKGRRGNPLLTVRCNDNKNISGSIQTTTISPLDTSVAEIFRPGRNSGNRLAIAKLIFEKYGSSLKTHKLETGYLFQFSFLSGQ